MKVILQWDGPPFEWSYEGVTCHVGGLTGGVICHDWSLAVTEELAVLMMVSPSW